jgi:hypothetical protein
MIEPVIFVGSSPERKAASGPVMLWAPFRLKRRAG